MEKLKKFKKPLVVLSLALVLALVWTTGASTYAKYITSTTVPTQNATVAKWGFLINANTEKLFGDAYGAATSDLSSVVAYDSAVNVKASSAKSNLVAPGTTGSMTFKVEGTAEVLSAITVKVAAGYKDVTLTKGSLVYSPIVWTLSKTVTPTSGTATTTQLATGTLAEIVTAINTDGKCNVASIDPNTSVADTTYTLSWEWKFTDSTVPANFGISADEADTILGLTIGANATAIADYTAYLAAKSPEVKYTDYTAATTVEFSLTITVEQIQTAA